MKSTGSYGLAEIAALRSAMRSSSAQTSAIRPEMTIRPAQSGRMAESDSRTTRKEFLADAGKARLPGRKGVGNPESKIESLLAVCTQGVMGLFKGFELSGAAGKSPVCPNEFLSRLIHGASACTCALQNGWTGELAKPMIFINNSN